jgi:hypothetical protein
MITEVVGSICCCIGLMKLGNVLISKRDGEEVVDYDVVTESLYTNNVLVISRIFYR